MKTRNFDFLCEVKEGTKIFQANGRLFMAHPEDKLKEIVRLPSGKNKVVEVEIVPKEKSLITDTPLPVIKIDLY